VRNLIAFSNARGTPRERVEKEKEKERERERERKRERERGREGKGDKERARNFLISNIKRYIENKTLSSGNKLMEVPR